MVTVHVREILLRGFQQQILKLIDVVYSDDDDDGDVTELKLRLNLYEFLSDTNLQRDFWWNDSDFMPDWWFSEYQRTLFATILYLIHVYQQMHQKVNN